MKLLTTKEAAEKLGVSARRVRAMITAGKLPAHQLGKEYAIEETVLVTVARVERKPGRPANPPSAAELARQAKIKEAIRKSPESMAILRAMVAKKAEKKDGTQ